MNSNTHLQQQGLRQVLDMAQYNKHGIRIVSNDKERKQMKLELQKLNFKEYAEFVSYEFGEEVKITIPNHRPLVQAMLQDGWILQKYSRGEIA